MYFISGPAFKECTSEGDWWRHPQTNLTWSNYTQCVDLQDLNVSRVNEDILVISNEMKTFDLISQLHCKVA